MTIDPPNDIELELVAGAAEVDAGAPGGGPAGPARVATAGDALELSFDGELWSWRGPAPYHFISVPPDGVRAIKSLAADVTYGWGMIPAEVRIGDSRWATALWPKDGGYVIPIKDRYRNAERLVLGDTVAMELTIRR
jgi:hypothetical protein